MTEKKPAAPQEYKALILVSPGGHKYEVTVSDHGGLNTKYLQPIGKEEE